MRGTDLNAYFSGGNEFFMAGSQPTSFSSETVISADLSNEPKVLGKWYTTAFPVGFTVGKKVLFWNTGFIGTQTSKFRIVLYEFDSKAKQEQLISESPWFATNDGQKEVSFELPNASIINAGNRLVASIELMDEQGTGKAELILDKPAPFTSVDWNSISGVNYTLAGVSSAAAIAFDMCNAASILCSSNQQCNDNNPSTSDICINPDTCSSYCLNEACSPGCTSNGQCADSNPETTDICKNIGGCSAYCSNEKCRVACTSDSSCSDGVPSTSDQCVLPSTCGSFCINKECIQGICPEEINVCGNGVCEASESCDADCRSKGIELIEPKGIGFYKGEEITIKVMPKGFVTFGIKPSISFSGSLGNAELFDDGKHNDESANDNIYGATITVPENAEAGYNKVVFRIVSGQGAVEITDYFAIYPHIVIDLNANPATVIVGQKLNVEGFLTKKGKPLGGAVLIEAKWENTTVFSTSVNADESGYFVFSYSPNQIDAGSIWSIYASTNDDSGNKGAAKATVYVLSDGSAKNLEISLIEGFDKPIYVSERVKVKVEVEDANTELLSGADVFLSFESGEVFRLSEGSRGIYEGEIQIPTEIPRDNKVRIAARKIAGKEVISGYESFDIRIKETEILLETADLLDSYTNTDTITVMINASYLGGTPATGTAQVSLDGKKADAKELAPGIFRADIDLGGIAEGEKNLSILFEDTTGKTKLIEKKILVEGASFSSIIKNSGIVIIVLVVVFTAAASLLIILRGKAKSAKHLKERQHELLREISEIQARYFKKGMLGREKYYELMLKYESELNDIRKELHEKK